MQLSIVTTLYYSQPYLREFHARASRAAQAITPDYELILVNDGSPDESLAMALDIHASDPRVKVVDLSRNFGHHKAIMTGLQHATGDWVFLIDCDLEVAPETLAEFHTARESQAPTVDVVYGVQAERAGASRLEKAFGRLFYTLFNALSDYKIPVNITTVRLMSARYVRALLEHREHALLIAGLWSITGFNQVPITIDKPYKGSSTYNLRRKLWHIIHAVTGFSSKPLVAIAGLGMLITTPSMFLVVYLVARYLVGGIGVDGYTSLIVSIWLLGGLIIFVLGVIAIYLSVIFTEVKNRPYTIVRQVYDHHTSSSNTGHQPEHTPRQSVPATVETTPRPDRDP
jgi:putative glycosyltransferase